MRVAVDRILGAIARQEAIAIHGDYDVDGVTSTVILRRAIEMLGGSITHFVPDRHKDGYGLQPATIERLHAGGARLVISVRLRHPRDRRGGTRPGSRRRFDHHGSSRA
jgi:single-stranded-DNA-specific exonuclease